MGIAGYPANSYVVIFKQITRPCLPSSRKFAQTEGIFTPVLGTMAGFQAENTPFGKKKRQKTRFIFLRRLMNENQPG
jgi:hypothetical protein